MALGHLVAGTLLRIAIVGVLIWGAGFAWFLHTVRNALADPVRGDAIVVLTGGAGRLAAGGSALKQDWGRRLLVSGVHPSVSAETLRGVLNADAALFACCVDVGRAARNTQGNALETAAWAADHGYRRLVVITSDYHMPRSLLMLRRAMPEAELQAYPVRGQARPSDLALEYSKYLIARFAARS